MRIMVEPSQFHGRWPRPCGGHDKDQSSRADSSGHESERMTGLDPCK